MHHLLLFGLLHSTVTLAEESPKSVDLYGTLRVIGTLPPDFVVDFEGNSVGQGFVLDSRLRPGIKMTYSRWGGELEGDLFDGQIAGDPWDLEGEIHRRHPEHIGVGGTDNYRLRKANLYGDLSFARIQLGMMTNHWGLGMVANDGAHEPYFGRSDYGDRVVRLMVKTQPFVKGDIPFYVSVAGDMVVEDDMSRWAEDQTSKQVLGSLLYADKTGNRAGVLMVHRKQTEADQRRETTGNFADIWLETVLPLGSSGWSMELASETAIMRGFTSRVSSYNSREGLDIQSLGTTGRLSILAPEQNIVAHIRSGYATGDGDPDDNQTRDFTFDRDFDVGMVFFDHHQAAIEVASYNFLNDPERSGQPVDGVDALVTEGAVRRTAFVQPILQGNPLPWLELKGGLAILWRTAPIANPYASFRNGGVPVNHLGKPTDGYDLGKEIDWSIAAGGDEKRWGPINPKLQIQGGHYLPSDAVGGDDMLSMVMISSHLRW